MSEPQSKSATHLQTRLDNLHIEHRDLDEMLSRMTRDHRSDDIEVRQLKKRKLQLKDRIDALKTELSES